MSELIFPITSVLMVFLIVIPTLTIISRQYLSRKRARAKSLAAFGSESTFAWIVAPTLLPIVWFISSAFHQTTASQEACLIDHIQATTCDDAIFLVGFLLVGIVTSIGIRTWRENPRLDLTFMEEDNSYFQRVNGIFKNNANSTNRSRILIVKNAPEPMFTMGWLRPFIVVDVSFIDAVDDEMILAALLHEAAHISGFDTFRGFIGRLCLGINPLGFLLQNDFKHWQSAREVECDSVAVSNGGQSLALAESIIRAARFSTYGCLSGVANLRGQNTAILKLRLAILFEGPPKPIRTFGQIFLGVASILLLLTPHLQNTGLLEHFHFEVERFFHIYL